MKWSEEGICFKVQICQSKAQPIVWGNGCLLISRSAFAHFCTCTLVNVLRTISSSGSTFSTTQDIFLSSFLYFVLSFLCSFLRPSQPYFCWGKALLKLLFIITFFLLMGHLSVLGSQNNFKSQTPYLDTIIWKSIQE